MITVHDELIKKFQYQYLFHFQSSEFQQEYCINGGRVYNEFHNLYASPNIVRVIKSRKTTWAGHVACVRDEKQIKNCSWKTCREEATQKT
jgi:hypothetical protein